MTVIAFPRATIDAILSPALAENVLPADRRLEVENGLELWIKRAAHIGEHDLAYALRAYRIALRAAREDDEEAARQQAARRRRMPWWVFWGLA
jgi:hypothetical protein